MMVDEVETGVVVKVAALLDATQDAAKVAILESISLNHQH